MSRAGSGTGAGGQGFVGLIVQRLGVADLRVRGVDTRGGVDDEQIPVPDGHRDEVQDVGGAELSRPLRCVRRLKPANPPLANIGG